MTLKDFKPCVFICMYDLSLRYILRSYGVPYSCALYQFDTKQIIVKFSLNPCNSFVWPVRSEHVYYIKAEALECEIKPPESSYACAAPPTCAATFRIQMPFYTFNNCLRSVIIAVRSYSALFFHFICLCFFFYVELLVPRNLNFLWQMTWVSVF
jgi:hypothetical protein